MHAILTDYSNLQHVQNIVARNSKSIPIIKIRSILRLFYTLCIALHFEKNELTF